MDKKIKAIEKKMEKFDYNFSAGEVAYLLNTIRVLNHELKIATKKEDK